MCRKHFQLPVGGMLAGVMALSLTGGVAANESIRACVLRDVQMLTLIEEQGNAFAVSGQILSDAMLSVLDARKACFDGGVAASLALYDRITQGILDHARNKPPAESGRIGVDEGRPNRP
jgi:hypothetical protein